MWDFISPVDALTNNRVDNILRLAQLQAQMNNDERYGIYTVTEAAGYILPITGPDFSATFNISLSIFCFLPWWPLKSQAEMDFIKLQRNGFFENASKDVGVRIRIASRVNRQAFAAVKAGATNLRPFDLFNFAT